MKVTPWVYQRSRPTKLDIELQRIREFREIYGLAGLSIAVVEEHPAHPAPFHQVSVDDWCCHIHKEQGCTKVTLTNGGELLWKQTVAVSDLAGVILGSLRTALRLEEQRDAVPKGFKAALARNLEQEVTG